MKLLLVLSSIFSLSLTPALSGEFSIFTPSRKSESLLIARATFQSGKLNLEQTSQVPLGFAATTICQHPELPILYISTNRGEEGKSPGASVFLDESGGVARVVPTQLRHGYSYLSLDRTSKFLLGCNYGDGYVDVYALKDDGTIGERVSGLDEGRKAAHCILTSPDNRHFYIPYVKEHNALYQYAFDERTGAISALEPKNANPPEGTGPRHMAYHPSSPFVYFSNEQGLGVSVYRRSENGQLEIVQVCEAVESSFNKVGVSSSDILITPDGRFLFAGIRGHRQDFDRISRYRVLENGEVELIGLTPADAIPWGLHLSPDNKFLVATAFKEGTLMVFAIGDNGDLELAAKLGWDTNVSDVVTR